MKRLFTIGSGYFVYSLVPILSWIALSMILHNGKIVNAFSLIYPMQFVWVLLKSFFGTAANIRKNKENDKNSTWNSIFWGTIFSIVIFSLPLIFVDKYIAFFGQNIGDYKDFVIYGIAQLLVQVFFSLITEKLYFEDKEKIANIHLIIFNILNFILVCISAIIIPDVIIAFIVTLSILLCYVVGLYIWQFEKFRISLSFVKNIKYNAVEMLSSISMAITYFFGFQTVFLAGDQYLAALNVVALATDAQFDSMGAISTVTKVDLSKQRYQFKRELKNAYLFTTILSISSILLAVLLGYLYKASFILVLIYLVFKIVEMFITPYVSILQTFTQLEYSVFLSSCIFLIARVVNVLISVFLVSAYCTDIAYLTECVLLCSFIIVRIVKYKVKDGKLLLKKNKKENSCI